GVTPCVLRGTSCLEGGGRPLDLQDRATRALSTILTAATVLAVGLPAQRAIAQRFSALALFGPDVRAARCPFVGVERTSRLCVPSPRSIDFRKKLQVDSLIG